MPSGTIAAIVGSIVIIILLTIAYLLLTNRQSKTKTPFETWSNHYDSQKPRPSTPIPHINAQTTTPDIHHFYNKKPRLSISQNTAFTPYVAEQRRNSQRNSVQFRNAVTKFDL
jgi:FtsZ-interacting cell division protein ZipA